MTCPYCGSAVNIVDSIVIYRTRSYGKAWVCAAYPKCDAYVGCHKRTDKPLGRLADKSLRQAKSKAHKLFDALWREKIKREKCPRKVARSAAYQWLAGQLGIHAEACHIGMFDTPTCEKVASLCARYFR